MTLQLVWSQFWSSMKLSQEQTEGFQYINININIFVNHVWRGIFVFQRSKNVHICVIYSILSRLCKLLKMGLHIDS